VIAKGEEDSVTDGNGIHGGTVRIHDVKNKGSDPRFLGGKENGRENPADLVTKSDSPGKVE